jgi:LytTr DNA-binding domain
MENLINWLKQPYPIVSNWKSLLKGGLIGGLFVTFFLFVFHPFGTYEGLSQWQILWVSLQFGLVTMAWTVVWGLIIKALPQVFKEEGWTVGREILFHLFFILGIGTFNLIFSAFSYNYPISWKTFWQWQWITLSIGIFPTVASVMYKQIKWMKQYSLSAENLSAQVLSKEKTSFLEEKKGNNSTLEPIELILIGDNQNERLSILPHQLLYIAAADNYVQVFYKENEQIKSKMLRTTLRKMEDLLFSNPQFYRCHRTFLVNLKHVARISGNAQGYKLHLHELETTIPVSRTLNEEIQQKIML